jgi:anaerobic magnesium-protoporphyrin IX monomethyl ester cyclase
MERSHNDKLRITLIVPCGYIGSIGLRIISAYLKQQGHETRLIFLNSWIPFAESYPDSIVNDVIELCSDSDLIGISLMTNYFVKAKDLTLKLNSRFSVPIIWGGIHATVCPDECIEYADMVCVGEGEDAMVELAAKLKSGDITNIANIWCRREGEIFKNRPRPLEDNLDKYPFPDYDISNHYFLEGEKVVRMNDRNLKNLMPLADSSRESLIEYRVLTTRNCPHSCTYCCNNALRKIYGENARLVRKRDVESVIKELEWIKAKYGFINSISIADETFFVRSYEEIKSFCEKYKSRIGLPMVCILSPMEIDEEKMLLMTQAGLYFVYIGIQSHNQQTLRETYKRRTSGEVISRCVAILEKYSKQIPHPEYLFIIDNPFENRKSLWETERLVASLPEGAILQLYPLVLFPGTEMHDRARTSGLIVDEMKDVYFKTWSRNDVRRWNLPTRLLYFHKYLRDRSGLQGSRKARILLKFRKTPLFYLFFLLYQLSLSRTRVVQELIDKFSG